MTSLRPLLFVVAALTAPAVYAQAAGDRVLVYVDDIAAEAKERGDANALTSALCGALGKDKRLDVMCAPDVKQIMGFAASSSMLGTTSPAVENLQRRLEAVKFVVSATLKPQGTDLVLTVQVGPKADGADAAALFAETALLKVEAVGPPKASKILDRMPDITQRLVKAMLSPAPSTTPPSTPPAPLPK